MTAISKRRSGIPLRLVAAFVLVGSWLAVGENAALAAPSWWPKSGHPANDYAAANQGQLKSFTVAAVAQLNANLGPSGGAGSDLAALVAGWRADYQANGYSASNLKPADYSAINVGQLKYVAGLVYMQLAMAGYAQIIPGWLHVNTVSDNTVANLGQLKQAFDFDFSLAAPTGIAFDPYDLNSNNAVTWTLPANDPNSLLFEAQNADGTWSVLQTLPPGTTSFSPDENSYDAYNNAFRVIAQNGTNLSPIAQTSPNGRLLPPTNLYTVTGVVDGEVDLFWTNDPNSDTKSIIVQQSTDGVHWTNVAQLDALATSYAIKGLTDGQSYYFALYVSDNGPI